MRIRWRNLELPNRVVCEEQTDTFGRFVVEPFERGFGTTVGVAMRRILLSSLEGTAVTDVRISGVDHEFMAVKGVYEDVTDIILNIKQLLVQIDGDGPTTLTLKKKGQGPVKAGDITTDHTSSIVNPDLVICNLVNDKASIEMTMTVKRGRGFVTADENADVEREIGVIYVDSKFSPVQRVRFDTENTRVGKMTNYDKLILQVWTNGTIKPDMALVEASKILRKHLNPFVQYFDPGNELGDETRTDTGESTAAMGPAQGKQLKTLLQSPIASLDLSKRSSSCIEAENIATVADLVRRKPADVEGLKNLGKTSFKEIEKKLEERGLSLGMDVDAILS
ncbi:MAG: DNA-directed RNA polymerase subunit alpha [Planctomycetota bacterium]